MAKPPALCGAHKHHDGQSGADKTMEDSHWTAQYHPQSGYVYRDGQNIFQQIQNDEHKPKRTHNLYWPFCNHGEWSLGKFLVETMTQTEINRFLKLSWFDVKEKPSFSSARELLSWMDLVPPRLKWCIMQFEVQWYTTAAPIHLIWCDDLEVAKSLFGYPIFAQNMSFDPLHVREAFSTQDQLPEGIIMPIIAALDKTPVTRQTGSLEMHPLFLTIGNIDSDIHMKATSHAWRCVAYIPIPKFETHSDYHTILKSCVWHKCVDLVFASLKVAEKVGEFMPDPFGELRYCFTPLVAWIADLPEQLMITSVSKNASPITLATHKQFGDANCHDPCTVEHTLELLYILSKHSSSKAMQASLNEFHDCKVAILEAEARWGKSSVKEDFYIPKLELLLSFAEAIRNNSGLIQFTADVTLSQERANRKISVSRSSASFDREEWMRQFDLYLLLRQHNHALVNAVIDEDEEVYTMDLTMAWVSCVAPNEQHHFSAPRPIRNHFTKGILSDSTNAALTVTCSPDGSNLSWPDVMHTYGLPDLCHKVTEYIQRYADDAEGCLWMFSTIKIWSKFRIQLHSTFRPSINMPSQAVQAEPPSDTFPSRNCDAIFLDTDQGANNPGFPVAQVCIVFQLAPPRRSTVKLPDFLLHPLLYVQPFYIVKTPKDLEDTQLWKLERVYAPATQPKTRTRFVIPIMEVTHAAELVPVYREKVDCSLTSATSQEHYDHLYLNRYADKEMYNALHELLDTEYTLYD
ncbi:hypothetical protein BDR07DRAFT_1486222 [Suillus spraguei]|nr:hypothetical protein BDR07DRAFT_1486222 [Suillus spraguei]